MLLLLLSAVLLFPQDQANVQQDRDPLLAVDLESLLKMKVVTASKFAETAADAPGLISVVTRDELKRFGGLTVREVLERVPGLSSGMGVFTERSIIVSRGDRTKNNSGHVLLLINGRPTREILEGGVVTDVLEAFPVEALERIEVIKGPGSVLYGSNAYSGVINLITRKVTDRSVAAKLIGGEQGAKTGSVTTAYHKGDFTLFAGAKQQMAAEWRTGRISLTPTYQTVPLTFSMHDKATGGFLQANYKRLSFMSSYTAASMNNFALGAGTNYWRRGFADLGYNFKVRDNWYSSVNFTYTRNTMLTNDAPWVARDSNESLLEWTNRIELGASDAITAGALVERAAGEEYFNLPARNSLVSKGARWSEASYAQLEHRLSDSIKAILGLQLNKYQGLDAAFVPRTGIIWSPNENYTFKVLYSRAYRAPSINENHIRHPVIDGNMNLNPEKVGTFDIGFTYRNDTTETNLYLFHSLMENTISEVAGGPRLAYVNGAPQYVKGIGWDGRKYVRKNWLALTSVTFQAAQDSSGRIVVSPSQSWNAKGGLSYQRGEAFSLGMFNNYMGGLHGHFDSMNPPTRSFHFLSGDLRYDLTRRFAPDSKLGVALVMHGTNLANSGIWLPMVGSGVVEAGPVHLRRTVYAGLEFAIRGE